MITYMHCRPSCATDFPSGSPSFLVVDQNCSARLNYQNHLSSSYRHHHDYDQSLPLTPRRCRRLDDPIIAYASNYYAACPRPMSQLPVPATVSSSAPPIPPPRRVNQQSDRPGIYCDLFNLLELPETSPTLIKQKRKCYSNDCCSRRSHRPMDLENVNSRMKVVNDRKRSHHHQTFYHKEKKCHEDKFPLKEQYERSTEKSKQINDIYQRRSPSNGFFRRVVRRYFCLPPAIANNGYSS